jgi:hypothetical protein
MKTSTNTLSDKDRRSYTVLTSGIAIAWFAAVVYGSTSGLLGKLHLPWVAALVTATIVLPTLWYVLSSKMRSFVEHIGHRRIIMMHIWRVPAALLFFYYGAQGQLPFWFWLLAGLGDLIAGVLAYRTATGPETLDNYRFFHRFGFADFVVAVSTGLTFTLMLDPLMVTITTLPLALVPLFGVGISGASHLMSFDMLRRGVGLKRDANPHPALA